MKTSRLALALLAIPMLQCSTTKLNGSFRCVDPRDALFETEETCMSCPLGYELKAEEERYRCVSPGNSSVKKDPVVRKAIPITEDEKGFWAVSSAKGQKLADSYGCLTCHTTDGTSSVGPSWKGLYMSKRRLTDGGTIVATESYLRESILNPGAKKISMPYSRTFRESMPTDMKVTEPDLANIVEYIKTLKD